MGIKETIVRTASLKMTLGDRSTELNVSELAGDLVAAKVCIISPIYRSIG